MADGPAPDDAEALREQVAYYRARAPEYDDWWERRGSFDFGDEFRQAWDRDVEQVRSAMRRWNPAPDVLELAAGTGNWTLELVRAGARVTAVDTSPETLAINREKCGDAGRVDHVVADVFGFEAGRRFEAIFFSFWISHVPQARTAEFWQRVDRLLAPGGRVFLIDNAHPEYATPRGPEGWRRQMSALHDTTAPASEVTRRRLDDGRTFDVVKRYWHPAELESELAGLGWRAAAANTDFAFLYAAVERSP